MKHRFYPFFVALLIMGAFCCYGQAPATQSLSFFQLLEKESPASLSITITSNFQQLISNKFEEEYQPASLSWVSDSGDSLFFDLKVKTRGNSRKEICFFPPLKINLKKSQLKAKSLNPNFEKYKLVTQCKWGSIYEKYLIKEYLSYKVMEQAYPFAFKVRMVNLLFRDVKSNGKVKEREQIGFIIESEEEFAERLGGKMAERSKSGFHHMERKIALQMAFCQYMIGNTDWAMPNLHNVNIIKVPEYQKLIPVPYDFDYAGLVDTDYAVVHSSLSIKDVRTRLYLGPSCTEEEILELIELMKASKERVIGCISDCELLDDKEKKRMTGYLESFFSELENESRMKRVLDY